MYFFKAVQRVIADLNLRQKQWVKWFYFCFTILAFTYVLAALVTPYGNWPQSLKSYMTSFFFSVSISKLIGLLFVMADDIIRAFRYLFSFVTKGPGPHPENPVQAQRTISRSKFISQVAIAAAAVPFSTLMFGMVKGAFDYTTFRIPLKIPNLPPSFEGTRILQLSDIHTGSFGTPEKIKDAIQMVKSEAADYIFFTGDLVNDRSDEALPLMEALSEINSPGGVYSILGNHDYGDYMEWPDDESKLRNMELMYKIHKDLGWRLLMNENVILKKGTDELAVIGVENWSSKGHFPKYGDLSRAVKGTENVPVKLLLTHDPSHWEAEVLTKYPDIAVTFSGHTHGMQFGVEIPGFKWSPAQYMYEQWAGLYEAGHQKIYVNRGLGFLGYAGRVGIKPEITVFELQRA